MEEKKGEKSKEPISAKKAMGTLGMDDQEFLCFLRKENIPVFVYQENNKRYNRVDIEEHIENKRYIALKREVVSKGIKSKTGHYFSSPYNEELGGGVGRAMLRLDFGDPPKLEDNPQIRNSALSDLFVAVDIYAYKRGLGAPISIEKQLAPDIHVVSKEDLSKKGQKGGKVPKIKQPILQATIIFLKEKPGRVQQSAKLICEAFTKAYKEEKGIKVNGKDYDVYYNQGRIYCKVYLKNETIEKSITLNTFKNNYISKAKEGIK